jgi:phenylacetic acid degradation operon negative regulatory protein
MAARPTFRNLTDSFEEWARRNGLQPHLAELERRKWIESSHSRSGDRLCRLTKLGCELVIGRNDPPARWHRRWDGKWRIVLFDVPQNRATERARLRRTLAARGFGYLQNSVWISPDPTSAERSALASGPVDVELLTLLEGRPCAGERDEHIVAGAWDFGAINASHEQHARVLSRCPECKPATEAEARCLWKWFLEERVAWNDAMCIDPLLPKRLLPKEYLGMKNWNRRVLLLRRAATELRNVAAFSPWPRL